MADAFVSEPRGYTGEPRYTEGDVTILGSILKRTSWGAVFAGAITAISLQMLMTVLGIAIGLTSKEAVGGYERLQTGFPTAPAVWWLVTGTASLLLGGCVVGRFAGMTRSLDIVLHGFTMWAVTAFFGFLVISSGAGALYGTTMDATFTGARAYNMATIEGLRTNGSGSNGQNGSSTLRDPATGTQVTAEQAERYVRTASWWTVLALVIGIAVSIGGSWLTAPERIKVRPASQGTP